MPVDILVGLQWGDEGKGKIIDILSPDYNVVARFQGGPNAGHTLVIEDKKFVFHTLPSGVIHNTTINVLGSGMVIDPITLKKEIDTLKVENISAVDRILISKNAHLILPTHRMLDAFYENELGNAKIGSTLKGIGPTYQDKISRRGLRIGDVLKNDFRQRYRNLKAEHLGILNQSEIKDEQIWFECIEFLRELNIIDTELYINEQLSQGAQVLAEGAQGTFLDLNFGTYPFVTSSNTISSGALIGLGISHKEIRKVYGVCKAYTTRVGEGPFNTEQSNEIGEKLLKAGNEFGSTTGRPRRCGWLDLVALKYALMLNAVDELIITKADVLNCLNEIKICTNYRSNDGRSISFSDFEDSSDSMLEYKDFESWSQDISGVRQFQELPDKLKNYIDFIEEEVKVKISMISVGPERSQTIKKGNLK